MIDIILIIKSRSNIIIIIKWSVLTQLLYGKWSTLTTSIQRVWIQSVDKLSQAEWSWVWVHTSQLASVHHHSTPGETRVQAPAQFFIFAMFHCRRAFAAIRNVSKFIPATALVVIARIAIAVAKPILILTSLINACRSRGQHGTWYIWNHRDEEKQNGQHFH